MDNSAGAAARAYHDCTKHSRASVAGDRHGLDWDNMPRPFKLYADLEPIPLPRDFSPSTRPALESIADPGAAQGDGPHLDLAALARLLHLSAGIVRRKTYPGGTVSFRAAACTGALYHIDLYVVCGPLPDLEAGVYHFGPHDFALRRLRNGDYRRALVQATGDNPAIAAAPATIACTSTFWRNAWKYRARMYRHCFWDNGTILANLLAAGADLPMQVVLGFADAEVNQLLDLDTDREVALSLVPVGSGATDPPPAPPAPPLGLAVVPPSAHEIDYPAVREMHDASSLPAASVAAWRRPLSPRPSGAPDPAAVALPSAVPPPSSDPIERVIERRGSTRVFRRNPIGLDALSGVLRAATRGVPSDFGGPRVPLSDIYLIAHAVDGLESGAYVFDRTRCALHLLRAGQFRREAGYLALGQALAADAAVNLYWLCDLEPLLECFGDRGYRAAQLDAAVEAGKTYLAAYALGLGATGLTFFDDDVTAFFSPQAAGTSVMFLMAVGPRRTR